VGADVAPLEQAPRTRVRVSGLHSGQQGRGGVNGGLMEPPHSDSEPRPANRSSRVLGLLAAVGFSIAMWVFIAMAVLGLVLKVVGAR
jgi:hypothetical protein